MTYLIMFIIFFLIFCIKYLFRIPIWIAILIGTHYICLYKEVDKKYTGCNLRTTELLDWALIEVCAVISSNTVFAIGDQICVFFYPHVFCCFFKQKAMRILLIPSSVRPSVCLVYPSVHHAFSSLATGRNFTKLATPLPLMVRVCESNIIFFCASVHSCVYRPSICLSHYFFLNH